MFKLVDLEKSVTAILSSDLGIREKASEIRLLVQEMLTDTSFLMSCIDQAISNFEQYPNLRPHPPLFISMEHQFAVHLIYWPAGHKNSPHMHSTWGTTGVFFNEIVIETFNTAGNSENPELTIDNRFDAKRGEAGYLLPLCVHRVSNETNQPSASLHLFGTDDKNEPAQSSTVWYGDNVGMPGDSKARAMGIFCEMLISISGDQSKGLLIRVFALACNETKLRIVKGISERDIELSYQLSVALEQELVGSDRARLSAINQNLAQKIKGSIH
ncbi:hypothetical protein EI165_10480 [Pseudoalteromonas nigrifaciens]|uniref:hypothetical protein n=1 Tax=Pseudoalteromonas nigrifaciens TaxID=28109 RepID=UPI0017882969|nr:hypothetical protein [Pseudoalteromonas nigrifaciens]MBE0420546.1 hypothetical protein [Pseudoalteromonas nigrifaciens]